MEKLEEKITRKCHMSSRIYLNHVKERRKKPFYYWPRENKYSSVFQAGYRNRILETVEEEVVTTGIMMNINFLPSDVFLGCKDTVELCKGYDANASEDDSNGIPLSIALETDIAPLADRLIGVGADVNACDEYGVTPLHRAVDLGRTEVIRQLLDRGATVDCRDNDGVTPLHIAADLGLTDILLLLLKRGANINSRDNFGVTPLHLAASNGNDDLVYVLAARDGLDLNPVDWSGWTPIELAAYTGRDRTVRLLAELGAYHDPMELQHLTPPQAQESVDSRPDRRTTVNTKDMNPIENCFQDCCKHCSPCNPGTTSKRRRA